MPISSDNEFEDFVAQYQAEQAEHARSQLAAASDLIDGFVGLARAKGVRLDQRSFEYVPKIGIVAHATGLAQILSGIAPTQKERLFAFQDLALRHPARPFQAGYFVGTEFMLMAHPYFRRDMHPSANWAPRFIELFWDFESPNVERYVAIDEDRVRINVDGYGYFEADTWYGAPFDRDVRMIPSGLVKLRPPLDVKSGYRDLFFAQSYCLDIKWSGDDRIKIFQALELKTEDVQIVVNGQHYFPARYLHAEFDTAANSFRHFDGAVQLFREDEYLRRRESDFNIGAKDSNHLKARSQKIFKLNGSIDIDTWVELCCHFFTGNPLTFEYFTGAYPKHVAEILPKLRTLTDDIGA